MKKLILITLVVLLPAGMAFAQWNGGWALMRPLKVEGTLQLQNGGIALLSGNTVYFVPMLFRYVGFIEGLKEGALISVEGYSNGYSIIHVVKIIINGKSYDFAANPPVSPGRAYYGRGCGGYGYGGYGRGCGW